MPAPLAVAFVCSASIVAATPPPGAPLNLDWWRVEASGPDCTDTIRWETTRQYAITPTADQHVAFALALLPAPLGAYQPPPVSARPYKIEACVLVTHEQDSKTPWWVCPVTFWDPFPIEAR